MASPPPKSKIRGWLKAPQRVFNRIRDATSPNSRSPSPALTETSTANIPNDDLGVPSSASSPALLGTDSADKVGETPGVEGNRSQGTIFQTTRPSSQQSFSHPETNTSDKSKRAWDVALSGLVTALRLLEKSADAFPPLKSAVGGLVACLDLAQVCYCCGFRNTPYHV